MLGIQNNRRYQMKRSILASVAAAALTLALSGTTASAQLNPDQQNTVRIIIVERLAGEMQDTLPDRLAEVTAALSTLTPEQRANIRAAIKARLADDVREGMAETLSDRLADRVGTEVQLPPAGAISSEQQAAIRNVIRERLAEEMQGKIADRVADAAAALANLSPEQRALVLDAVRARLADEVRDRLGDTLAADISQKLPDSTVGSGAK
jgi:hypothetical protein